MHLWFRRSILAGMAAALTACGGYPELPLLNAEWLLGQWQGGVQGQLLTVTAIEAGNESARGTWAGAPVSIIVTGGRLRFVTPDGLAVSLAFSTQGSLIGTVDRAPWLRQARAPVGYLHLRRVDAT